MSMQAKPGQSVGVRMKRKEDPRFLQGKGNYVDDITRPGMLFLALVRSPYPHARIKSIGCERGNEGAGREGGDHRKGSRGGGARLVPTFHGLDKQMVLAIGKVLFQYQEVAAVFAETRGAAVDGAEIVQVDYDPLPVVADPFTPEEGRGDSFATTASRRPTRSTTGRSATRTGRLSALGASEKRVSQRIWSSAAIPRHSNRVAALPSSTRSDASVHVTSQAPACLPHRAVARDRNTRRQDSRHVAGPRRRVSATRSPSIPATWRAGVWCVQARASGEVDRDADRESDDAGFRAPEAAAWTSGSAGGGRTLAALRVLTAADHPRLRRRRRSNKNMTPAYAPQHRQGELSVPDGVRGGEHLS